MGPFEHFAAINEIEIRNGQWASHPTEIASRVAAKATESSRRKLTAVMVIVTLIALAIAVFAGSRTISTQG